MKNKLTNMSIFLLLAVIFMTGFCVFNLEKPKDRVSYKTIINITSDEDYELGEEHFNNNYFNEN